MSIDTFFKHIEKGDLEKVKEMLEPGIFGKFKHMFRLDSEIDINNTDRHGTTALMYASRRGYTEMVKLLLEKGANVNAKDIHGNAALIDASMYGRIKIVKLLLEKGANVNAKNKFGNTALMIASGHGYTEIVNLLLDKGVDINAKDIHGGTALMNASMYGRIEIFKLLLDKGADVNVKDKEGNTLLMNASQLEENIEIVKLLLEKGADVNVKDKEGNTLLMNASVRGDTEIVKLLLKEGADVNAKDKDGATALMNASVHGDTEIVKLLLKEGADVNAKDKDGATALINASMEGDTEIVKLLLEKGADVNVKNKNDETAADIADNEEIRALLEAKMDKGTREMWKGLTKGDIERVNGIFEDNAINYSLCPVCLKYVERSEACMYMKHNCSILKGDYYHRKLYERFKDTEGIIHWCTICSRICHGYPHSHYDIEKHDSKNKPELFTDDAGDPFEDDCRHSSHGGGLPEKLLRFRRLREVAKELQDEIGKISERKALDELVEEVWNAPLRKDTRAVKKIMESKKWNTNINLSNFRKGNNNNSANAPNIPFEGKKPTKLNSGMNDIMRMEDDNIIQFHHKQKDGSVKEHGCTEESLERYIGTKLGEFGTPNFGYCFLYPSECKARLHPEEVKGHIPDKLYKSYKEAFNKAFQDQRGGNRKDVFQEAEDAQCVLIRRDTTSKRRIRNITSKKRNRNTTSNNWNRKSRIRTKRKNVSL